MLALHCNKCTKLAAVRSYSKLHYSYCALKKSKTAFSQFSVTDGGFVRDILEDKTFEAKAKVKCLSGSVG